MKAVSRNRRVQSIVAFFGLVACVFAQAQAPMPQGPMPQIPAPQFSPNVVIPLLPSGAAPIGKASGKIDAPASTLEFLAKAEAADKIEDPLARCLAFPDLPGNHWPKGLARVTCDFDYGPRITLDKDKELIDRGAYAELDALFAADLARHFSKTNYSEVIHEDFTAFGDSYDAGRITKKWLDNDPDSPYAMDARARYYRTMAAKARGGGWAADTPDENMARMAEFSKLAVDLYLRAVKAEPRLLPAYVGLMDLGGMNSSSELLESAMVAAKKIDPTCPSVLQYQMRYLQPRWGGSYEQMTQLANEMQAFVSHRPLIAVETAAPAIDRADRLLDDEKYDDVIQVLTPIPPQTTNPKPYEDLAVSLLRKWPDHGWDSLIYLLEAARFGGGASDVNQDRGWLLTHQINAPDWALKYIRQAITIDPENVRAHYLAAQAYVAAGKFSEAEAEYRIFMQDKDARQGGMYELITVLMRAKQPKRALDQAEVLTTEYPEYAQGWLLKAAVLNALNDPRENEVLQKFVVIGAAAAEHGDFFPSIQIPIVKDQLKANHVQFGTEW
jgi:thioredoxin-like negative regulator of GroEL